MLRKFGKPWKGSLQRVAVALFAVALSSCGGNSGSSGQSNEDSDHPSTFEFTVDLEPGATLDSPTEVTISANQPEMVTSIDWAINGRGLPGRYKNARSIEIDPVFLSGVEHELEVRVSDTEGRGSALLVPFATPARPDIPAISEPNRTCVAPARPASPSGRAEVPNAFPELDIGDIFGISGIVQIPGHQELWYVLSRDGRVMRLRNDANEQQLDLVMDLRDRVVLEGEGGLLGMAFHPRFPEDPRAFIYYTGAGNPLTSHLSSFISHDEGLTLDSQTEKRLVDIPLDTVIHMAGHVAFGPDGNLYFSVGDGGPGGDPHRRAQNPHDLRGSLLRIDVDAEFPYGIPSDNPFASGGGRPEIYAWGFRNPWKWSFDRESGELWVGDVGQERWEEVNRVNLGGNYGWPILEGPDCYPPTLGNCDSSGLIGPVHAYGREDGVAIIGGFVYRGTRYPELYGTYIYGDYFNKLWALEFDSMGDPAPRLLLDRGLGGVGAQNLRALAEDQNGELYYITRKSIHHIEIESESTKAVDFPSTLRDTGCLATDTDGLEPAPGVIPYEINVPFWSDGATKERWLALPEDTEIRAQPDGQWDFPIGTLIFKHFRYDRHLVETRMLVRHDDGDWAGYTYEWDDDQNRATLLAGSKRTQAAGREHWFPSRSDCLTCHGIVTGRVLGLETGQLNKPTSSTESGHRHRYNQLTGLATHGLLTGLPDVPPLWLPHLPNVLDARISLPHRAAAYLHSNCAYCHQPGGAGRGTVDLRYNDDQPLQGMGCDSIPQESDLGLRDPLILRPGAAEQSILSLRMHQEGANAMPPLGRLRVDTEGLAVIDEMIQELEFCP